MGERTTQRPGAAERPQESGAAAPGRGGRMSRQRKTAAVLRLLRGEDLETVSRGLGVTAGDRRQGGVVRVDGCKPKLPRCRRSRTAPWLSQQGGKLCHAVRPVLNPSEAPLLG